MDEFEPIDTNSTSSEVRTSKCSHCGSRSETIYQKEASPVTYVLSFASLFVFQFWAIFIIPVIVAATQQVAKRCYDCDAIVEKHNLFSLPSMNILLSQTWIDFVKDCGSQVYVGNSVRANSHYVSTYHQNSISWEGIYGECIHCPRDFVHMQRNTEYQFAIKMNPTDSAYTDLLLSVSYEVNQEYISVLKNIAPLDVIQFTAEFQQLGSERALHMLSLKSISHTGRKFTSLDDVSAIQN